MDSIDKARSSFPMANPTLLQNGVQKHPAAKRTAHQRIPKYVQDSLKSVQHAAGKIPYATTQTPNTVNRQKVNALLPKPGNGYAAFICNAIKSYGAENTDPAEETAKAPAFDVGYLASFRPKNAQDLLEAFIAYGRENLNAENVLSGSLFTLTPEHPTIVEAMQLQDNPKDWIYNHIIKPGMDISNQTLSASQKTGFINALKKQVVPKENHHAFNDSIKRISPQVSTVHDFSNKMIEIISKLTPQDEADYSALQTSVTAVLLESVLPSSAKKVITATCVHIADTNWIDQNDKHINFACFYNPITKTVALGTISEDGSNLRPQDPKEWSAYIPWEMHGIKLNPALAGHKIALI